MRQVIRLPEPRVRPEVEARRKAGADALRPFIGRFVAQRGDEVLCDAEAPQDVVAWIHRTGAKGAVIFRVPVDPEADMGMHGQD